MDTFGPGTDLVFATARVVVRRALNSFPIPAQAGLKICLSQATNSHAILSLSGHQVFALIGNYQLQFVLIFQAIVETKTAQGVAARKIKRAKNFIEILEKDF